MPKDCGCKKKEKKQDCDCHKKPIATNLWVYKKSCDNKLNVPDNSYLGKIGFTYYLVDNDKKESTQYKADLKFSNLNSGEIVYYVNLYKVTKTKFDKKTNTTSKYLECAVQYSYTSKLDQNKITDIINKIGNDNYDLTPDDTNKFNSKVIQNILKTNGTSNNSYVKLVPVGKSYGDAGCNGSCADFQTCGKTCPYCVTNGFTSSTCQNKL